MSDENNKREILNPAAVTICYGILQVKIDE
jgi:hypothetical protein